MKHWVVGALSWLLLACPVEPMPSPDGGPSAPRGCDAGTFVGADGACHLAGWTDCGEGFAPADWGCEAVVATCDAGAMSVPGEACTPIGWARCPAGFVRSGDGWSCEPTLPAAPCTGATRAAIGSATCVPVGDCAALFPPANATHFVDPDGGVDATHFVTISAALAAAPTGAVIAVAAGSYAEPLVAVRPVKLVGRCAQRVRLTGSPAVFVDGVQGVELEGFTLRDAVLAARVERGGVLTLRHAVLEANFRSAVQALDPGTRVVLEDVVVRDTQADPATQTFGQGIAASFGAQVTLTDVELAGNLETALFLDRAQTSAALLRVVVSRTAPRASTGKLGWGVAAQRGAVLTASLVVIEDSTVSGLLLSQAPSAATLSDVFVRRTGLGLDNNGQPQALAVGVLGGATLTWAGGGVDGSPGALVHVQDPGSAATVRDVTVRGARSTAGVPPAGVRAEDSAKLTLDHVAVFDTAGSGVVATSSSELTVDHLGVFDSVGVGLRAQGARVTGVAVEVRGHAGSAVVASEQGSLTLSGCVLVGGASNDGIGAAVTEQAVLSLSKCVLGDNVSAGVLATLRGLAYLSRSIVRDTRLDAAGEFGQGAVAQTGAAVTLTDVMVTGNHSAGLQVADFDSLIDATRVTVRSTLPNGTGTRGRGANANLGGAMRLSASALVDNRQVGLFVLNSRIDAVDTVVLGTRSDPDGSYGNGLEVLTDGVLTFTRGAVEGSAGIAAVFAEGAGVVDGARIAKNAIGLHVQDGSTVEELARAPASVGARQVVVTSATSFEENQSKLSAGTIPLPPP